ncbi:MAG: hypothetical protein ACLFWB_05705 [Armatimonadota bacterium]
MRCEDCRRVIGTMDLSEYERAGLQAEVQEHLENCPECEAWAASTHAISESLRSGAALSASESFTPGVMEGLQERRSGVIAGAINSWFGDLRPVAPVIPRAAVAASFVAILLVIAVFATSMPIPGVAPAPETAPATDEAVVTRTAAPAQGNITLSVPTQNCTLDDLIKYHQDYHISRPLGPDAGMVVAHEEKY